MIFLIPNQLKAETEDVQIMHAATETVDDIEALDSDAESEVLLSRLEEINEMDKSDLTHSEKRELRKEVRQIDKTLNGGGVYLSVGAIIIVILLLILLL